MLHLSDEREDIIVIILLHLFFCRKNDASMRYLKYMYEKEFQGSRLDI